MIPKSLQVVVQRMGRWQLTTWSWTPTYQLHAKKHTLRGRVEVVLADVRMCTCNSSSSHIKVAADRAPSTDRNPCSAGLVQWTIQELLLLLVGAC